jgi:hypothetical protein
MIKDFKINDEYLIKKKDYYIFHDKNSNYLVCSLKILNYYLAKVANWSNNVADWLYNGIPSQ